MNRFENYQLLEHNTFGIEAKARLFVEFATEDELVEFLTNGHEGNSLVIGGGSNLLFVGDFDGTIFHSAIRSIEKVAEDENEVLLRVGSGVNWDELVEYTVEQDLYGLENLSLIPGEAGASAVQNVGAYGVEAGDLIEKVETIVLGNASKRIFSKEECHFAYRYSIFKGEEKGKNVVTYVTYRLKKSAPLKLSYGNLKDKVLELGGETLANVRRAVCDIRRAKLPDPADMGSAGSFFMNPVVSAQKADELRNEYPAMPCYPLPCGDVKLSAGWLIEQCGWKETPHKHVGVYKHQALVVVNLGGAKGCDVIAFANEVVDSVKKRFGVELNMEVNVIG